MYRITLRLPDVGPDSGACSLDMTSQPVVLLPEHVQQVLLAGIAVAFVRQADIPYRAAVSLDGIEQPLAVERERAGMVVGVPRDQRQGFLDLVAVIKGIHLVIKSGRFPLCAFLFRKAEGRRGALVRPASGEAGVKQAEMRKEVGLQEGA